MIVARDVTDRHRLDFDQGDTGVLRAVMANMHGMVVLADETGAIRSINGAVTRLLGYDPELIRGRSIFDYLHPEDREHVLDAVRAVPPHGSVTLDARFLAADHNGPDDEVTCEFTVNNLLDDPVVHSYVISAQIATALADARNRVNFLAEHDSRTGLLNRDGFLRHAEALVAQGGGLGILVVDIVHFRSINELYGEPTGDAVLSAIADRIDKIRWPDLITARFGGDEFVLAVRASNQYVTRDAPRTGEARRVAAVHDRRSGGELPDPHRQRLRRPTRSARLAARQREQRADGREAILRGRDDRHLGRRDQRTPPSARPAASGADQR